MPESPNFESPDEPGEDRPVAQVITQLPLPVRLVPLEHPGTRAGHASFATHLVNPESGELGAQIALGDLPQDITAMLLASEIFAEPVHLGLTAWEEEGGIRGLIFALVPPERLETLQEISEGEDEPWRSDTSFNASAYEDALAEAHSEEAGELTPVVPFTLGVVMRFAENRVAPDDLGREAADLFGALLSGGAMHRDAKQVENLLRSI
jgi:hypothetical protein